MDARIRCALGLILCLSPVLASIADDSVALVQNHVMVQETSELFEAGELKAQKALEDYFEAHAQADPTEEQAHSDDGAADDLDQDVLQRVARQSRSLISDIKQRVQGFGETDAKWEQVEKKAPPSPEKNIQFAAPAEVAEVQELQGRSALVSNVQNLQQRFSDWAMLPAAEKKLLKESERQALELLSGPVLGMSAALVKSKLPLVGPQFDKLKHRIAAKKALHSMVAKSLFLNPALSKAEAHEEVRKLTRVFTEKKAEAQKRIQKALMDNSFDWENADAVHALMQDWREATKSIVPKAQWEPENPNCFTEPMEQAEKNEMKKRIATVDGQPNLRAWCYVQSEHTLRTGTVGSYLQESVLKKCILDGDSSLSAVQTFAVQKEAGNDDLEASYCFLEGHCYNAALDKYSTAQDGEQVCDMRYGHKAWTSVGFDKDVERSMLLNGEASAKDGLRTKEASAHLAKVACAMGSFHCDAALCQAKYCKDPHYKQKYESLYGMK